MQIMKKCSSLVLLGCFLLAYTANAQSSPEQRKKQYNLESSGLAIQGYDPVAYFTQHKGIPGQKDLTAVYSGVTYRFSSLQDKDLFVAAPEKYEPQYGGWCAYAMGAKGEKVSVDPETFKIIDGKLYLFYNSFFNNTLKDWNKDEAHLKSNADLSWKKFIQ